MQTKIIPTVIKFEPVTISVTIETLGELVALFAFFNLSVRVVKECALDMKFEPELAAFCQRHADFTFVETQDNPFDTLYNLVRNYHRKEKANVQANSAGSPAQSCD